MRTSSLEKITVNYYIYISTNEVGIAKITSKCLWGRTDARMRFGGLFLS